MTEALLQAEDVDRQLDPKREPAIEPFAIAMLLPCPILLVQKISPIIGIPSILLQIFLLLLVAQRVVGWWWISESYVSRGSLSRNYLDALIWAARV